MRELVRLAVSFASNLRNPTVSLPLLHAAVCYCSCITLLCRRRGKRWAATPIPLAPPGQKKNE